MTIFTNQIDLETFYFQMKRDEKFDKLQSIQEKDNERNTPYAIEFRNQIIAEIMDYFMEKFNNRRGLSQAVLLVDYIFPLTEAFIAENKDAMKNPQVRAKNPMFMCACIIAEEICRGAFGEVKEHTITNRIQRKMAEALGITKGDLEEDNKSILTTIYNLLLVIEQNTGITTSHQVDGRDRYVALSPEWKEKLEWLKHEMFFSTASSFAPMIAPPKPHSTLLQRENGYHSKLCASPILKNPVKIPMIPMADLRKPENRKWATGGKQKLEGKNVKLPRVIHPIIRDFNAEKYPLWFKSFNKSTATAMKINKKALDLLNRNYEKGLSFPKYEKELPNLGDIVLKEATKIIADKRKVHQAWETFKSENDPSYTPKEFHVNKRRLHSEITNKYIEQLNKTNLTLDQAADFSQYDELFFPKFADYRGRVYPYTVYGLNPQGDDLSRALLQFAKEERMTESGLKSMFHSLGNCLSYRKTGEKLERYVLDIKEDEARSFFNRHLPSIIQDDWTVFYENSDSVFKLDDKQCINAMVICLELFNHLTNPTYKTGYVSHRDARCSGVSIMGSTLGDRRAMELTGVFDVVNEGRMEDAYEEAAKTAKSICLQDLEKGVVEAEFLMRVEKHIFTRSNFKYPVMIQLGYGGSDNGLRRMSQEMLLDLDEGSSILTPDLIDYFKNLIWRALGTMLPSCVNIIAANKEAAKQIVYNDENQGVISVNVPITDFPMVIQKRVKFEDHIDTAVNGKRINPVIHANGNLPNERKMITTAPPCFIHAIDAILLILVEDKATFDLATIHDSIGTHPNHNEELVKIYAEAMVDVIKSDYWREFYKRLGVDVEVPFESHLTEEDLQQILDSKHILV